MSQYNATMRPADFTSAEIADQLARMYRADQGKNDDRPSVDERSALADDLGCHEEARAAAWAAWCAELGSEDQAVAEYWLDVEFIEPCPEGRAV